jgi:hypothetical protein
MMTGQLTQDDVADFAGQFESAAGFRKIRLRLIARIADIHAIGREFGGIVQTQAAS